MKYNRNTGNYPKIDDRVEICHTNSTLDTEKGVVIGFVDMMEYCAIVLMDKPVNLKHPGVRGLSIPVSCLKQVW